MEMAKTLLPILETCNWQWDILTILEQPKPLLDAIVSLKATGMRLKRQKENREKGKR